MTATIRPFCNVNYTDVEKRKQEYCEAVNYYITKTDFDEIVFAENSGEPFDGEFYTALAEKYNKKFEYLNLGKYTNRSITEIGLAETYLFRNALEYSHILCRGGTFGKSQGVCELKI